MQVTGRVKLKLLLTGFACTSRRALIIKDSRPAFPRHVLLVAYSRTGSSFVGDLLNSLGDWLYFYEPLFFMQQPALEDNFEEARDMLAKLFTCRVSEVPGFLPWIQKQKSLVVGQKNALNWRECRKGGGWCTNSYFEDFCLSKATVLIKTVRLSLLEASRLFETHPELNLKVIYLVRDPRGTINSRKNRIIDEWCKNDITCFNTTIFCSLLSEDVKAVCPLLADRPGDFLVVRYEDVCTDAEGVTRRLVGFLGMTGIPPLTKAFLKTHTYALGNPKNLETDGVFEPYSTFRNSSARASNWRRELGFERVTELQKVCSTVLNAYGYPHFYSVTEMVNNADLNEVEEDALPSASYCQSGSMIK